MNEAEYVLVTVVGDQCNHYMELNRIYISTIVLLATMLVVLSISFVLYVRRFRSD